MTARAYALMTGIFVVVLVGAIGTAFYWFGGSHVERENYVVVAHQSIMGLHGQSTVYYRGVPVGKVTSIGISSQDVRKTLIGITINGNIPITASTYATLHAQGVTGLATLELNDSGKNPRRLPTSAEHPAPIPLHGGTGLSGVMSSAHKVIVKLNGVAESLQQLVGPQNRQRINAILTNTAHLTAQLSNLEKRLDSTLSGLPGLEKDARGTLHHINELTVHLTTLTDSLHALSGQMNGFAKNGTVAARELAQRTLPKLGVTLKDLQDTAQALQDLSHSLENNPQQLIFGPAKRQAGPGEPGFQGR
ncbi:MAG TPA: MlaD family protein [Gammaproteobacteria bacterium]|nr:MlaD family protein [Gammaproteobacteria bacterium]